MYICGFLLSLLFFASILPMDPSHTKKTLKDLFEAIKNNDTQQVESIAQKKPSFLHTTLTITYFTDPITVLHYASAYGKAKCASVLLKNGAQVNFPTKSGITPLYYANNKKIARVLLDHGADIHKKSKAKATPLWTICCPSITNAPEKDAQEIALLLLEKGAKIDQMNSEKNTILHCSITFNKIEAIDFLLKHNADVTKRNKQGFTPLQLVWQANNKNIFNVFEKHGIVFFPHVNPGQLFYQPLHWGEFLNNRDHEKYFTYWGPLLASTQKGKKRTCGSLLSNKDGCVAHNISQEDLLFLLPDLPFIEKICLDIVDQATEQVQNGQLELLEHTLSRFPWVIHYDKIRTYKMMWSAMQKQTSDCLKILLKAGINPQSKVYALYMTKNSNFLHYAIMEDRIHAIQQLIEYKINFLQTNDDEETPMDLAKSLGKSQYIKELNKLLCKEFIAELESHHYTKAKKILKELEYCFAPIDEANNNLINNLIHVISCEKDPSLVESFFKILKSKNADFNAQDDKGETPLWALISFPGNRIPIFSALLKYGANPRIRLASCQHSLLDIAIGRRTIPLVELFIQYGAIVSAEYVENIDEKLSAKKEQKRHLFTVLKNAYDKQTCIICFEHSDRSDDICFIPCKKNQHTEFICKGCHKKLNTCPLCRNSLGKFSD